MPHECFAEISGKAVTLQAPDLEKASPFTIVAELERSVTGRSNVFSEGFLTILRKPMSAILENRPSNDKSNS